jgi:hypothetical protein
VCLLILPRNIEGAALAAMIMGQGKQAAGQRGGGVGAGLTTLKAVSKLKRAITPYCECAWGQRDGGRHRGLWSLAEIPRGFYASRLRFCSS